MSDTPEFSIERQIHRRLQQYLESVWFNGHTVEQLWRWQVELRQQLRRSMRLDLPTLYAPPKSEHIETTHRDGFVADFIALETQPEFWLPLYILRPTGESNGRTLIAIHGEGRGAVDVVGLADNQVGRKHIEEFRYDYAVRWARAGFLVAAPELRGYGRLMLNDDRKHIDGTPAEQLWRNSVDRLRSIYLRLGQTYAGCCVADLVRVIDYLESRADVDPDRIGIGGLGEGARALGWLIAVEDRIAAAAVAAIRRCEAEMLLQPHLSPPPMLDARAAVDHASLFACFAPRPLLLQGGRRDKEVPPEVFQTIVDRLSQIYSVCDAETCLIVDTHGGGRVFRQEAVIEFFNRWI